MKIVRTLLFLLFFFFKVTQSYAQLFDFTVVPDRDSLIHSFVANNYYSSLNEWNKYRGTRIKVTLQCKDTLARNCETIRYTFFDKAGGFQKDSALWRNSITRLVKLDSMILIERSRSNRLLSRDTVILNEDGNILFLATESEHVYYEYDSVGILVHEIQKKSGVVKERKYKYRPSSVSIKILKTEGDVLDNKMRYIVFNRQGKQLLDSTAWDDFSKYIYDKKGELMKVIVPSGKWIITRGPGQNKSISIYSNDELAERIDHTYQNKRTLTINTFIAMDGNSVKEIFKFDRNGKIVEQQIIGLNGEKSVSHFDTKGRKIKEFSVTADHSLHRVSQYQYIDY